MSPAPRDLILKTVVPAVGTVVCFFLYLAPARAVLAARRRGCLGVRGKGEREGGGACAGLGARGGAHGGPPRGGKPAS